MISVKLSYIAKTLGWRHIGQDVEINQLITDSRRVDNGDCFIALYGDNFDAHDFIPHVIDSGVAALIVSKQQSVDVPQLVVSDTRLALGQLAALNARLSNVKKITITGSCGKTTVKEMLSAILSTQFNVLSTAGNFNNDIGVPLTLLRLDQSHDIAVVELGANHVGEIDYTSGLVEPDVAIITNIGAAHLEGFGSIDGVVTAKSEIFNHLSSNGTAIFDGLSEYCAQWQSLNQQRNIARFYASESQQRNNGDVFAHDVGCDENGCAKFTLVCKQGELAIKLALPGLHNVVNALAASAGALALGVKLANVASGLANMEKVNGRLNSTQLTPHLTVIDDTYNANAGSIKAAIELLAQSRGQKILVLGSMGELGEYALTTHQSMGPIIEQHNIDLLVTYGQMSEHYANNFNGEHHHFDDKESLNKLLEQRLISWKTQEVVVLAKGSRSTTMESVVEFIKNNNNIIGNLAC